MAFFHSRKLGALLVEHGVVPPNTRDVDFHVGVDSVLVLRCEILLRGEDLAAFRRALTEFLEQEGIGLGDEVEGVRRALTLGDKGPGLARKRIVFIRAESPLRRPCYGRR